jgi:hypothetical protein
VAFVVAAPRGCGGDSRDILRSWRGRTAISPRSGSPRPGAALAVAALLRHAGGPWRVVGFAMAMPPFSWLARLAYGWVARNRHRFRGLPPVD